MTRFFKFMTRASALVTAAGFALMAASASLITLELFQGLEKKLPLRTTKLLDTRDIPTVGGTGGARQQRIGNVVKRSNSVIRCGARPHAQIRAFSA